METENKSSIIVETTVNAPVDKVWTYWTEPEDIVQWNNASDDCHTPHAENDLQKGGRFSYRMEAKDKSFGFDFAGTYDDIRINEYIEYTLDDGRKVQISFSGNGNQTKISETFQTEDTNSVEMQRQGWHTILDNFKKYTESH